MIQRGLLAAGAAMLLLAAGCSMQDFGGAQGGLTEVVSTPSKQAAAQSEARSEQLARMLMSWKQQQRSVQDEEYPLGPEDVLEITVFALERPGQPSVLSRRVNVDGKVNLPFVGDLQVAGLTARQAVKAVAAAYEGTYLKNPQVDVNVTEYRSSPVVVTGAVKQPGIYYLRRRSSTVLEMLSLANGLALEAGNELLIVRGERKLDDADAATATNAPPAEVAPPDADTNAIETATASSSMLAVATNPPAGTTGAEESKGSWWSRRKDKQSEAPAISQDETAEKPASRRKRKIKGKVDKAEDESGMSNEEVLAGLNAPALPNPDDEMISIDLRRLLDSGDIRHNIPVRGGDVITVPPRQKQYVYVLGYVQRPGALEVREGENLQALQAVAMAGGLSGSARAQNSTLITENDGSRKTVPVDLTSIKRGNAPPAYLKPGDILIVGSSSLAKFAEFIKLSAGASYSPMP
ncbi:MAG: polysaccharide biosynthesis/export family protein [Lentisphaerae bacterium]|nr:polysaccharide biosynthesis/export family protein [Lentisphaerota bacterium]